MSMEIKADEISRLIEQKISGFEKEINLRETGIVISIGDGIARIYGLENAMSGELLDFPQGITGMALNLEEDNIGAARRFVYHASRKQQNVISSPHKRCIW